eukprot:1168265-Pyramimonas_sp.AAC.1
MRAASSSDWCTTGAWVTSVDDLACAALLTGCRVRRDVSASPSHRGSWEGRRACACLRAGRGSRLTLARSASALRRAAPSRTRPSGWSACGSGGYCRPAWSCLVSLACSAARTPSGPRG